MTFYRIKQIKGNSYIYLVKNVWVADKGSRQKVLAYIGRAKGMHKILIKEVYERDGYSCQLCEKITDLEIDHKIPLTKGGDNHINNLWILCKKCNRKKGVNILPQHETLYKQYSKETPRWKDTY